MMRRRGCTLAQLFVVIAVIGVLSAIASPAMAAAKGPYEAIIYVSGTTIYAQDSGGNAIDSGTFNSADTRVFQSAATYVKQGFLFIQNPNDANNQKKYVITSKITMNPGTTLVSDHALIDISGCNDIAFQWGSDDVVNEALPDRLGMRGLKFWGSEAHSNSWVAQVSNHQMGILFEDLEFRDVYNGIRIRGEAYEATVRNCQSTRVPGVVVELDGLTQSDGHTGKISPDQALIDHCFFTAYSNGNPVGMAVKIMATSTPVGPDDDENTPDYVTIRDSWFEGWKTCILNQGFRTQIENCVLDPSYGAGPAVKIEARYNNGSRVPWSGELTTIANCKKTIACNGYPAIEIDCPHSVQYITHNQIESDGTATTAVHTESAATIIADHNALGMHAVGFDIYPDEGAVSLIHANRIQIPTGGTGIHFQGGFSMDVMGNTFEGAPGATNIDAAGLSHSQIKDNAFTASPVVTVGSTCTVSHNLNYLTESSGSSTGTGSSQTIAHGLAGAPKSVSIVPTVSGATVSGVWADATSIHCTVTDNTAFNWRAER